MTSKPCLSCWTMCAIPCQNWANNPSLQGSASIKNKQVFLTVVNTDIHRQVEAEIVISSVKIKEGIPTVFSQPNMRAYNGLDNRHAIKPLRSSNLEMNQGRFVHAFLPASVTALRLILNKQRRNRKASWFLFFK